MSYRLEYVFFHFQRKKKPASLSCTSVIFLSIKKWCTEWRKAYLSYSGKKQLKVIP